VKLSLHADLIVVHKAVVEFDQESMVHLLQYQKLHLSPLHLFVLDQRGHLLDLHRVKMALIRVEMALIRVKMALIRVKIWTFIAYSVFEARCRTFIILPIPPRPTLTSVKSR